MNLAWIEKLVPALSLSLLIGMVGCGGETATTTSSNAGPANVQSSAQTSAQLQTSIASVDQLANQPSKAVVAEGAEPTTLTARSLTGVWLGEAVLDRAKLEKKVSALEPQAQKQVTAKVTSFLSTVMAMEFRENGTVENEVEIRSTDGKLLRDGSVGSWRVLESKPNGLLIQTQERLADGTVASDQLFYQFSGDRNRIAVQIPVSPELAGCDAMIVFDRQTLAPTNVATGPTETLTK